MWYYTYTAKWFQSIVDGLDKSGIQIEKTFFGMILMREINTRIKQFLLREYDALHVDSGHALQIFAPVKPPESICGYSPGPDDPLAECAAERQAFLGDLNDAGISISDLPKILFFAAKRATPHTWKFANVKGLSLAPIELDTTGRLTYEEFFSELMNIADHCYLNDLPFREFFSRIQKRFRLRFLAEKIRRIPVISNIYEKRLA